MIVELLLSVGALLAIALLVLDKDDVQAMNSQLRQGIVDSKPEVQLSGDVEGDEVYVNAGHKANHTAVRIKGRLGKA